MLSHVKQTDVSVPYRDGDWWYYSRTEEGLQYGIYCRKRGGPAGPDADAAEEILLDGNELAKGHAFFAIGDTDITDDGRWLAYTTDTTGFRQYTLRIKDLETGETLADEVERVGSVVWAADNRTLFYTVEDEQQKRQFQLCRATALGRLPEAALVYQEDDERFNIGVGRTRDGKYIVLESASHTTSEARFLAADHPTGEFTRHCRARRRARVLPRPSQRAVVHPHQRSRAQLPAGDRAGGDAGARTLDGADCASRRRDARGCGSLRRISLSPASARMDCRGCACGSLPARDLKPRRPARLPFPSRPTARIRTSTASSRRRHSATATSRWSRPVRCTSTTWRRAHRRCSSSLKIPGGFDRTLYASERIHATAPDGVAVPISIVYRKDKFANAGLQPASAGSDPRNPLYVYGYGSYGYALPLGFSSNRLSLLDRGVVMAYAHIRGGGDLGKPWHDAGKMLVKRNTFTDFIACVEHLTAAGYGDPHRVAIEGGSAGGLLMGAVANMSPRALSRRAFARAVCRRDEYHARRFPAPHGSRVRGVGRPEPGRVFPLHAELFAVRQLARGRVPGDVSKDQPARQPGDVLGAGQVRGQTAHAQNATTIRCCW